MYVACAAYTKIHTRHFYVADYLPVRVPGQSCRICGEGFDVRANVLRLGTAVMHCHCSLRDGYPPQNYQVASLIFGISFPQVVSMVLEQYQKLSVG